MYKCTVMELLVVIRECIVMLQAYVLMTVLSLTADRDAAVWKGFVLIISLFVVNILATASFVSGSTIGHITGTIGACQILDVSLSLDIVSRLIIDGLWLSRTCHMKGV